ncbi:phosphodiester glycosidase family protein [Pseudosulfitobacter koreensis]|uniref:Phosphodiester glycosidase family protein n=1 Tax=Pseudosulfitobacter koreensis TaxID=2968472 RepID=A0ABT1Z164_9RHOB|nr:phosphodiester glycosidase family protein [Pseudosulfitobacter koreense]MCR8826890.1 phosphodiester glycosidase family protein [Pseudosulfitobacter koreense]
MRALLIGALVWLGCGPVWAAECENREHAGNRYTICSVDLTTEDLRLFLRNDAGGIYGSFNAINQALGANGQTLGFAMNAGMYHEDRAPVGLYVEDGQQEMGLVTQEGPGNFGLLPNGVLCLRDGRADVIETLRFARENPACTSATQSGPMLVIDGELHPRFLVDATSRYVRNGVGTSADGHRAVFAISNNPVTFHEFGSFFRDALDVPQALYFDGNVSRLYAPGLGRHDPGRRLGPIIGTVARKAP